MKHRSSLQKSLCPVAICPYFCSSATEIAWPTSDAAESERREAARGAAVTCGTRGRPEQRTPPPMLARTPDDFQHPSLSAPLLPELEINRTSMPTRSQRQGQSAQSAESTSTGKTFSERFASSLPRSLPIAVTALVCFEPRRLRFGPLAESREFKGGFSKGGFSNNNIMITHKLLNPPLLNPPL